MNIHDLTRMLTPTGGAVKLARDSLDGALAAFLDEHHRGLPIVIGDASLAADGDAVVVTGKASFGDAPDLPVVARFTLDAAGALVAELRYTLRDASPGPAAWTFSRSFRGLPGTYDLNTGNERPRLDALDLFDSALVLRTAPGRDPALDVPLATGINFVSRMRPHGPLGVLARTAADNPILALHGVVRLPRPAETTIPLQPLERPWDRLHDGERAPAPGIYLEAALALDFRAGKARLQDSALQIYSPLTADWLAGNPGFEPLMALTATLAIPSAGIAAALTAELHLGAEQLMLHGQLRGVALGKLTDLLDFAGTDDLVGRLPDALRKPVDALAKLELTYLGLDLVFTRGLPHVRTLFATVGFPDLRWQVWSDNFVVDSLSCLFTIFSPFAAIPSGPFRTRVVPTLLGELGVEGARLQVSASGDDGFVLRTATLEPVDLPLARLVKSRGPGVPVPGDLTINHFALEIAPGNYYDFEALIAGAPKPWTIAVGKQALTVRDVALQFRVPSNGATSGEFSGAIELLADAELRVKYTFPGELVLHSTLPPIGLGAVIARLCDRPVKLPKGLDLELGWSSVLIHARQDSPTFQLCSDVPGLGVCAFEARREGGAWGFAYGLELSGAAPSKVPGLAALAAIEQLVRLQKLVLVVSSIDQPGFQLPSTAQFNNPALATKKVALPGSGGVTAGVNVFAEWALDGGDQTQNLLRKLLALEGTLGVAIQIGENPADDTRLVVSRSGKLQGLPFAYTFGVALAGGKPNFFLTGTIKAKIQQQEHTFDVTAAFVPSGAFLSASIRGGKPIDFKLFKLANVGLEIGVNWAGVPSLGVTGVIDIKGFQSSVAVFFDSTDPSRSLVAGSVSDLSLKDVLGALVGPVAPSAVDDVLASIAIHGTRQFKIPAAAAADLDDLAVDRVATVLNKVGKLQVPSSSAQVLLSTNKRGELWHLTDLTKMRHYALRKQGDVIVVAVEAQLYCAPQATAIGAITFPQGFYINGALELLGWGVQATVDISHGRGLKVEAEMDRLVIRDPSVFALTSADGKRGPKLSISTMADPTNPVAEHRTPHVYISGAVQLLGLKNSVLASLTTRGLLLELKGNLAPGVEFDLDVEASGQGFALDGDIRAGIGTVDLGELGKIKLDTSLEGSLGIRASSKELAIAVEGEFEFLGEELSLGRFTLDGKPDALAGLAGSLTDRVAARLRDVFKDAGRWTDAIGKGVVDGVEDTEKVLRNVYGKSEKEAKQLAGTVARGATSAVKTVSKKAGKFGKKLKKIF